MTTIIFNGTGSSTGSPQLFCDCSVCKSTDPRNFRTRFSMTLISEATVLQIDFPFELKMQLLKSKISRIDAGWLTHAHSDHIAGIDDLRLASFKNGSPLPIFLNKETLEVVQKRFPYLFFENEYLDRPFLKPVIVDENAIIFNDLELIPIKHFHGGFVVASFRAGDFALVADVSSIAKGELDKLKGVKILAIATTVRKPNARHLSLPQALDLIEYISPQKAFLTHLNHTFDYEETVKILPKGVLPAFDGLKIDF